MQIEEKHTGLHFHRQSTPIPQIPEFDLSVSPRGSHDLLARIVRLQGSHTLMGVWGDHRDVTGIGRIKDAQGIIRGDGSQRGRRHRCQRVDVITLWQGKRRRGGGLESMHRWTVISCTANPRICAPSLVPRIRLAESGMSLVCSGWSTPSTEQNKLKNKVIIK